MTLSVFVVTESRCSSEKEDIVKVFTSRRRASEWVNIQKQLLEDEMDYSTFKVYEVELGGSLDDFLGD